MKQIKWLIVEWFKAFVWIALLCVAVGGFFLFRELSTFVQVIIGGLLLILVGAYLLDKFPI